MMKSCPWAQCQTQFNGAAIKGANSQATAISELCKAHYQKLISAIELYSMSVTVISFDALAEFILGEKRNKLREDCFAFIHGLQELALMPFCKLTNSNRKIFFVL